MRLRGAIADDVAAVVRLEHQAFGRDAWSEASVCEELTGQRRLAVVACTPDVVGYAVTATVADTVDLQRLVVLADHRRHGLARRLLAAVARPRETMLLEVSAGNHAAQAFYAAEGFCEIDRRRRYYRDGSDAVVLRRLT